jgi:hypothetical protein
MVELLLIIEPTVNTIVDIIIILNTESAIVGAEVRGLVYKH